jgi:two-component system response regulator AtoC
MADQGIIQPENLPQQVGRAATKAQSPEAYHGFSLKEAGDLMERSMISRALSATGGNKSRASTLLEISYPSLLTKIKKYRLDDGPAEVP